MTIKILPEEVASQIAAGEVIERPASVVKELLENSLDAGASRIDITVEEAGRKRISISDDGRGIPSAELALAVSRHATSKIHEAGDLSQITTLGFRGEALASIASVSRFTLSSRPQEASVGGQVCLEGGKIKAVEPAGLPAGTTVVVEDLFFNVPARLKFLKADRTERARIAELVGRYALGYPAVRFSLRLEGKTSLHTSGRNDLLEAFAIQYGPELMRQMLQVRADFGDVKIEGLISPTSYTRSNRNEISFFVNGRWVQDPALTAALLHAYHTMLMSGRYPQAALFITIPPAAVDVNVHPAKTEVRFKERDRIFSAVQNAVRRALLAYNPIQDLSPWSLWRTAAPADPQLNSTTDSRWLDDTESQTTSAASRTLEFSAASAETIPSPPPLPKVRLPILRLIGQVGAAYLIAEGPDGLYLIDQHAAHERVLFEKLMAERVTGLASQALLTPLNVSISPAQAAILEERIQQLSSLGFEVEPFGPGTFSLRSVPTLLSGMDPAAALLVLVEDFEEDETPLERELEALIAARICKRAAVKSGQVLTESEQRALLEGLEGCTAPRTCPHGRPTMIHLSVDLLERQFGRRGPR